MIVAFLLLVPCDLTLADVQRIERQGADGTPDAAYLAPLAKLLADPDLQTRGLAALALLRHVGAIKERVPDDVVAPLLRGLRDENVYVARYVERTLLALGVRAVPEVLAALGDDRSRDLRLRALEAVRLLVGNGTAAREPLGDRLWSLVTDADAVVRARAFLLLTIGLHEGSVPPLRDGARLVALSRRPDERLRDLAAEQLTAFEGLPLRLLTQLLDDRLPHVRTVAARLLTDLLDSHNVPPLHELLDLLTLLHERTQPETRGVRDRLARVVLREMLELEAAVVQLLDSSVPYFRPLAALAVHLLTVRNLSAEGQTLLRLLASPEPWIRQLASEALQQHRRTGGNLALPLLEALATVVRAQDAETRRAAARALRLGLRPGLPISSALLAGLHAGLAGKDDWVRIDCTYALAACGARAEPLLVALLQDTDAEVQYRAAEAVVIMVHGYRVRPLKTGAHLRELRRSPHARLYEIANQALAALFSENQP